MAKRFTETELWKKQRWFRKLHPNYKLAFLYLKDQCDHAGFWRIDCSDLIEDTGLEAFNLPEFIMSVNLEFDPITGQKQIRERVIMFEKYLWITGFIQFQYESKDGIVTETIPVVKSAIEILKGYGKYSESIVKGFLKIREGLHNPYARVKDKDKDKDKDKEVKEKERDPRNSTLDFKHFSSDDFFIGWNKLISKPKWRKKVPETLQRNINQVAKYPEGFVIEVMQEAFDKDWQGLVFESTPDKFKKWQRTNKILPTDADYSKDFRGNRTNNS